MIELAACRCFLFMCGHTGNHITSQSAPYVNDRQRGRAVMGGKEILENDAAVYFPPQDETSARRASVEEKSRFHYNAIQTR